MFHFNTYRLIDGEDFENTIGTDYFHSGLCIIEWGEIIKDILPTDTIYITITRNNEYEDNERTIEIHGGNN